MLTNKSKLVISLVNFHYVNGFSELFWVITESSTPEFCGCVHWALPSLRDFISDQWRDLKGHSHGSRPHIHELRVLVVASVWTTTVGLLAWLLQHLTSPSVPSEQQAHGKATLRQPPLLLVSEPFIKSMDRTPLRITWFHVSLSESRCSNNCRSNLNWPWPLPASCKPIFKDLCELLVSSPLT